jgi:DNA mismatch endonuclease (patch repair protein)
MTGNAPDTRAMPSSEAVSTFMKRMGRRDTKPELLLRRELHRRGLRFRTNLKALPGTPDVAFTRAKIAVFVDGCFWHACPDHLVVPHSNRRFWETKLATNRARDRRKDDALASLGWTVLHIWEHEPPALAADRVEARWRGAVGR